MSSSSLVVRMMNGEEFIRFWKFELLFLQFGCYGTYSGFTKISPSSNPWNRGWTRSVQHRNMHTYLLYLYILLIAILLILNLVHELLPIALLYGQCPLILTEVISMFSALELNFAQICSNLCGPHIHTYCTVVLLLSLILSELICVLSCIGVKICFNWCLFLMWLNIGNSKI